VTDLTREQVTDVGRELADELGLPNDAAELASFYLGLGLGAAIEQAVFEHPAVAPATIKSIVREVLSRGGLQVIQTLRAYLTEVDPEKPKQ